MKEIGLLSTINQKISQMKNIILLKNFSWLYLFITVSATSQTLSQKIDTILKARCLDHAQTSINIVALPSGQNIYAHNALTPLLPASVMKIITTAAALHYLTPEYRFKTTILYSGERKNGVIHGDLIIRGSGDPTLSTENLWRIATQIKASGINEIRGKLVLDTHFFDKYDRAPSWQNKRSQRAYDAKLSALSLDFNTFLVHVQAGEKVGDRLNVWLEPPYLLLKNKSKTIRKGKNTVSLNRTNKMLWIDGNLSIKAKEKRIYLNVINPLHYVAETFHALLKQVGITINKTTAVVFTPSVGTKIYEHRSKPLSIILKGLNTYSNNLTAEQILKTIAAEHVGIPGSHKNALKLIKNFLQNNGVITQGIVLADGSGLSRKNRMTSRAITDLLSNMYIRFDIGADFLAALTNYASRLTHSSAYRKIKAKTGSLNGVSTLAGYVESKKGKVFGYALFLNNNQCGHRKADTIEDSIVTAIYNSF